MLADPRHWESHYRAPEEEQRILRHFSYSDRIRYYWPTPAAQEAVERLLARLTDAKIPLTLVSQFFPRLHERVASGAVAPAPRDLALEAVRDVLRLYRSACRAPAAPHGPA